MPSIVQASASLSTVAANPITVGSGVSSAVTLTVLDASGDPIAGVAAAACVLSVTGSNNTVTQPTGVTNADGVIAGSFSSTTAEAKTASFTVAGLAITDTAVVTVASSSTAPAYNAVTDTLVYAADASSARFDSVAASGASPVPAGPTFVPQPSPAYDGPAVGSSTTITTGKDGIGKALRITYPNSGSQQGGRWAVVNQGAIAAARTNTWRVQIRFGGTNTGEIAVKFGHLELDGVAGGSQPQWSTHNRLPYVATDQGKLQYWQFYDSAYTDDVGAYPTGDDQGTQPRGPYMEDLFDGAWHEFVFQYKSHASAGVQDGFARLWCDGVQIIGVEAANVGVTPSGGYKQWCTQAQVDNMAEALGLGAYYGLFFGGTMSTTGQPEWFMELNLGDGDPENSDTFAWWTD